MGRMLGMNKAVLPENDDDDLDKWFERCDADVEILATAWRKIRDWMTSNDLGSWKMTGASQGWTVWRRRFYTHKVLVHDDEKSLLLERAASYAGRAEGFRYGKIKGRATEFDYRHSYASTCAHANVPTRKVTGQLKDARSKDQVFDFLNSRGESAYQLGCSVNRSAIVDATVHVEVPETGDMSIPVLPFRTTTESGRPGKIIWPQGTFRGQWWLPELLAAEQAGQLVDMNIHSVTQYICEPALSQWANWAISVIDDSETPPIIAAVVKQWTRTLVGRFGLRYVEYSESNIFPGDDTFQAGAWIFGDRKNELSMNTLQIGEQIYISSYTKDGSESSPQIMSYVMMLTRLRLLEAMQAAGGIDNVLYCDTDGFIVNEKGSFKLRSYADLTTGYLRKKSSYTDLFIYGPKQLIIEGKPRVAGLPSRPLQRNDDGSWKVEKWERTRASLESGRVDTVRVRTVDMHIAGANGRRSIVENDDQITQTLRVEEEVSQ